ncbi:unnamed protein product [Closterium sp. Naga37s-1]|nr:unnamed protein product [Closterium sp. Naga37s-1]
MPRQPKKVEHPPVSKTAGGDARESTSKGHQSEPATPKPLLKDVGGPFADETRISLVKKLASLKSPNPEKSIAGGDANATEEEDNKDEVSPPAIVPEVPAGGEEEDEEEDDGYLSNDPEERLDPVKAGEIAARAGFSITLLILIKFEDEVPRTMYTVKGLIALWRKYMSAHVLTTTRCQVLLPTYLSKKRYGRMQVTFQQASDANYVWCRRIEHKMTNDKSIFLDWQHPENPAYTHERATNPDSIELLLKSVPAAITPEMVFEYLVTTELEKRHRTPFLSGAAFHCVVDPVTAASHAIDARMKKILRDPALTLISTGGSREDWICVQEECGKAHGTSFTQAEGHVKSVQHCTALLKGGAASRASKGKLKVIPVRKEFGM